MTSSFLEDALGHPAKIRILRALKKPGSGYMSINQLARATELNAVTLARTLRSLQDLGLANYIQAGKSQLWRLSEGYAGRAIGPVIDAMEKIPDLTDILKTTIANLSPPNAVEKIILFGSVARGEHKAGSDVDLLLLRSDGKSDIEHFLDELTNGISQRFWMNPSLLVKTHSEFNKLSHPLRKNILEGVVLYEKK
jgi:predicted nucleotidyltransferase